jgi:hypothetical protein
MTFTAVAQAAGGSGSSTAQVVTAIATLVTAVGGIILAFSVLLPILRNSKDTRDQVGAVHVIVNQQRTDLQRYNAALLGALKKAGIEVPVDQSVPIIEEDAGPT